MMNMTPKTCSFSSHHFTSIFILINKHILDFFKCQQAPIPYKDCTVGDGFIIFELKITWSIN